MTLADIENLLEEKDNLISTLAVEIRGLKEENEINYLKLHDVNKRNVELSAELSDEKMKNNHEGQLQEISKLRQVITQKSEVIEEERKRLEEIRIEFNKRLEERGFLEDEMLKNSVHIPERMVENSEKAGLFQKIQNLRLQINKVKADGEKIKKQLEESKKKNEEIDKKKQTLMEENRNLLNVQVNDTKAISRLTKEKDDLKEKLKELKNDLKLKSEQIKISPIVADQQINEVINKIEENQPNQVIENNAKRANSKIKTNFTKKNPEPFVIEKEKKVSDIRLKEEKTKKKLSSKMNVLNLSPSKDFIKDPRIDETPEVVIKRLVYFCVKKNINMQRHLMRYDITKIGKINLTDFSKAIDELKLGFIEPDISKLLEISKSDDNFVEIKNFIGLMIKTDNIYENILKEFGKICFLN